MGKIYKSLLISGLFLFSAWYIFDYYSVMVTDVRVEGVGDLVVVSWPSWGSRVGFTRFRCGNGAEVLVRGEWGSVGDIIRLEVYKGWGCGGCIH